MEANLTTNSDRHKQTIRTKYVRQPKNDELEASSYLVAKIERERDYFHTCIYSQY